MNDNWPNYSNPYTAWGPMSPFIAPWVQVMQAWARAMSPFVPGAVPPDSCNQYPTYGPTGLAGHSPALATPPRVTVRVSSQHRTAEVSACVDPGADALCLSADALVWAGDRKVAALPLEPVVVKCDPGHVHVSVTVPDKAPAGHYSGAIRDAAGCRRGVLTVQISKRLSGASGQTT